MTDLFEQEAASPIGVALRKGLRGLSPFVDFDTADRITQVITRDGKPIEPGPAMQFVSLTDFVILGLPDEMSAYQTGRVLRMMASITDEQDSDDPVADIHGVVCLVQKRIIELAGSPELAEWNARSTAATIVGAFATLAPHDSKRILDALISYGEKMPPLVRADAASPAVRAHAKRKRSWRP